jgi:hypothetical protein
MGATPVPVATKIESVIGLLQHEVPVRPVNLDRRSHGQIGGRSRW